jgi:hypothetical protein
MKTCLVPLLSRRESAAWRGGPTDTFKSRGPESTVTRIATTVMSTFDVIKRAAAVQWISAGAAFCRP